MPFTQEDYEKHSVYDPVRAFTHWYNRNKGSEDKSSKDNNVVGALLKQLEEKRLELETKQKQSKPPPESIGPSHTSESSNKPSSICQQLATPSSSLSREEHLKFLQLNTIAASNVGFHELFKIDVGTQGLTTYCLLSSLSCSVTTIEKFFIICGSECRKRKMHI